MIKPDWIAVDWGTTNLRVWAMDTHGAVLEKRVSDAGMGGLDRDDFEPALLALVSDWLSDGPTPVICCGMVGSRLGWIEAPYRTTPCIPVVNGDVVQVKCNDKRLSVFVVPGVKQENPADVMRGEETQLAGYLADHSKFSGTICLPGTHTKWVQIDNGMIQHFKTYMTGELFALLSKKSVLKHFIQGDAWDNDAFLGALGQTLSAPAEFAGNLFRLRAESLISELDSAAARARLSGLLIGLELAASTAFWQNQQVVILGEKTLAKTYRLALNSQKCSAENFAVDPLTIKGLQVAFNRSH